MIDNIVLIIAIYYVITLVFGCLSEIAIVSDLKKDGIKTPLYISIINVLLVSPIIPFAILIERVKNDR